MTKRRPSDARMNEISSELERMNVVRYRRVRTGFSFAVEISFSRRVDFAFVKLLSSFGRNGDGDTSRPCVGFAGCEFRVFAGFQGYEGMCCGRGCKPGEPWISSSEIHDRESCE